MGRKLDIRKTIAVVIGLNMLQAGSLVGIALYNVFIQKNAQIVEKFDAFHLLFFVILLITLFNSLVAIRDRHILLKMDFQYSTLKNTLQQVENLNYTLRAQRHDFLNHLQVVYSLMEMEEFQEAKDYIDKVYSDIQKVGKVLKTSNVAVNALLQAKMHSCEQKNIDVAIQVTSQLKGMGIPSWELCRVLGNLIDNAMDALCSIPGKRVLEIGIHEDMKSHIFSITNEGTQIPQALLDKIFEAGFTTKGEHGQGMGLFITKGIVEEHGGTVSVESDGKKTLFTVSIPKSCTS